MQDRGIRTLEQLLATLKPVSAGLLPVVDQPMRIIADIEEYALNVQSFLNHAEVGDEDAAVIAEAAKDWTVAIAGRIRELRLSNTVAVQSLREIAAFNRELKENVEYLCLLLLQDSENDRRQVNP